ncbi:MAG: lamin tail domain-containing protein, partial [Bacteroidota bacterium]
MSKLIPFHIFTLWLVPLTAQISADFSEGSAAPFDIIINEIMEDATIDGGGTLGLPALEYVELCNRSDKTINLENFEFSDGGTKAAVFPSYELAPDTYLLIGKKSAEALMEYGDFLGLANFPTLSSEETLTLKNEFGDLIDVVSYTQDWYGGTSTAGGGYSLERINPQSPCEGMTNWQGSSSFLGGTPGSQNAVFNLSIAATRLNIIDAYPISDTAIRISFNKKISEAVLTDLDNYSITNHLIESIYLVENSLQAVILNLQNPLSTNVIETVTVADDFSDCLDNPIDG